MLHIVLSMLKILLILLAAVLGLALAILCLVLFVPVRYDLDASVNNGIECTGRLSWLFRFVSICARYHDRTSRISVKLLGFSLLRKERQTAEEPKEESENEEFLQEKPAKIRPAPTTDALPQKDPDMENKEPKNGQASVTALEISRPWQDRTAEEATGQMDHLSAERLNRSPKNGFSNWKIKHRNPIRLFAARIRDLAKKITAAVHAILEELNAFLQRAADKKAKLKDYQNLWQDAHTQYTFRHVKKELRYLLKHWFPRKIRGNILFGLEDPAQTGQLLGILCMVQAFSDNRFYAEADFQEPKFKGDFSLKGHVRMCHLLKAGLALLFDKHFCITLGRVKKLRSQE